MSLGVGCFAGGGGLGWLWFSLLQLWAFGACWSFGLVSGLLFVAVCVVRGLLRLWSRAFLAYTLACFLLAGFALAPYFDLLAPLPSGPLNSELPAWLGLRACLLLTSPSFFLLLFPDPLLLLP